MFILSEGDSYRTKVIPELSSVDFPSITSNRNILCIPLSVKKRKKYGSPFLRTFFVFLQKRYPNPEKELPIRNKTYLGAEVKSIHWGSRGNLGPTGKKAILVKTSDGARYTADFVIMTVSLGVLKEKASTMFDPPIPEEKLNTIQVSAFGALVVDRQLTIPLG